MERVSGEILSLIGDLVKDAEVNIAITTRQCQIVIPFSMETAQKINELRGGKASEAVESPKKQVKEKKSPQRQEALKDIFGVCKAEFNMDPETVRAVAPILYGEPISEVGDDKIDVVKNTMKLFPVIAHDTDHGADLTDLMTKFRAGKKLSEMSPKETASLAAIAHLIVTAYNQIKDGAVDYLKLLEVNVCQEQGDIQKETQVLVESNSQPT